MNPLRDRIAAVITEAIPDNGTTTFHEVADAVIEELGLKRADGPLRGTPVHRYITDWIPNG